MIKLSDILKEQDKDLTNLSKYADKMGIKKDGGKDYLRRIGYEENYEELFEIEKDSDKNGKNSNFQNLPNFSSFGKIFPKLDFTSNLIYTYSRGENYDRKNRVP